MKDYHVVPLHFGSEGRRSLVDRHTRVAAPEHRERNPGHRFFRGAQTGGSFRLYGRWDRGPEFATIMVPIGVRLK
jgi:hypothetical protein